MSTNAHPSPAEDLALIAALEALGVEPDWAPVRRLRIAALAQQGDDPLELSATWRHRRATLERWIEAYRADGRDAFLPIPEVPRRGATIQGLLSGRLVEEAWAARTRKPLPTGFVLKDAREQDPDPGWDFEISSLDGALGFTVDVKLHSTSFRESEKYTGLLPDDCVPLGVYKMLVSRERQARGGSHHLYAFLFRPGLAEALMAALEEVPAELLAALRILFETAAPQRKRQQRLAVGGLVKHHYAALAPLLDGYEFRVISTRRAAGLFLEKIETRAPMLRGQGQSFGSTINMHYSWTRELTAWEPLVRRLGVDSQAVQSDFAQGRV